MAYKVLGQIVSSAAAEVDIVTASGETIISTVTVCNRTGAAITFRLSVSVAGGATAAKDYFAYDESCPANKTITYTIGLTLGSGDKLRGYAAATGLSFGAFGKDAS